MSLTPEDVQSLIAAFEESEWDEMTLSVDGTRLALSRTGQPPAGELAPTPLPDVPASTNPAVVPSPAGRPATEPPSPPVATGTGDAHPGALRIAAPSVGLFWRSPQPGAPHFVDVGQTVGPEDTVCIVEVMKLMNHVASGVAGVVRSVEVENGAMVEHGQVLFVLDPIS